MIKSIKKSTAAFIRNAKNRLYGHFFTLFSFELFDVRVEKAAVFFDKIINLLFLLYFVVIRILAYFLFFSTGECNCW